jgi:hypothetical protein
MYDLQVDVDLQASILTSSVIRASSTRTKDSDTCSQEDGQQSGEEIVSMFPR